MKTIFYLLQGHNFVYIVTMNDRNVYHWP